MKEFIITFLFGGLGVHKFMQRKYVLGILYLFTFGLFGIGWFIDTIVAFVRMLKGEQQTPEEQLTESDQRVSTQTKKFTEPQLEGMKKADILEMAAGLGFTMTTIESDVKNKIIADFMTQQEKQPSTNNKKWLIKTFNTEIVGTFAKCDLDKSYERSEVICSLKPNSSLNLEYWEYKGEPAFYVCDKGLDAGCVPAIISKTLHDVYGDCEHVVTLRDEPRLIGGDWMQKIRIDVYK